MTVCIAAICDSGKRIVVAADRMFTNPGLSVEFETEERKIEPIARRFVALPAGNSVFATEMLATLASRIGTREPQFKAVSENVRHIYSELRAQKAEEAIVMPALGADFIASRTKGTTLPDYLQNQHQAYAQLMALQSQQNVNSDIILAGIDDHGAQICQITHPGIMIPWQKLGYATIGSGGIHAMLWLSLSGQVRQRGLYETMADVYIAKKRAEVAPGVGKTTDVAVIDDSIHYCGEKVEEALNKIYEASSSRTPINTNELQAQYDGESKPAGK
jgi:hypothetical protein